MLVLRSRSVVAALAATVALLAGTAVVAAPAGAVAPAEGPVLTAPDNDGDVAGNPVLRWESVPGASVYRVVVSTSASFSPAAYTIDTANLNATPPTELANATYFWRVAAGDAAKAFGPWSQTWTFRKGASAAPTGLAPADATTFSYPDETPVLQWSPMAGVKSYKLQIDDDSQFLTPIVNSNNATTANTSYAVTAALTLDKTYYWRVWGVTAGGQETVKTDARSFMVSWPDSKPTLTSPANGATVSDVVLTWAPVPGAKEYTLEVSANGDFTNNLTESKTVRGTQYSPATTYSNGGYFWRVTPKDTLGRLGSPADARGFTRASASPSAPTNLQASTTQLSFSWSPVPNGGVYEIQFDADGNFNSGAKACTTFHARYTAYDRPSGQPNGTPTYPNAPLPPMANDCTPGPGTWQWRVRALDTKPGSKDGQFGPFSATQTVTVAYPAPAAGSLAQLGFDDYLSPADCTSGCTPQADTPLLKWNAVPGAKAYQVRIALDPDFTTEVQRYNVVGTELQPRESLPDNQAGTSYYWWVQPCSDELATTCTADDQASITATAHSFKKLADPVALTSPADDAQVTDVVTLAWSSTYATQPTATGVGAYRVQIANDAGFTNLVEAAVTVDQTTYQSAANLYPDSRYYWRVQAIDSSGLALSWSTPRSFVKKSSAPSGLAATRLDDASAIPVLSWQSTSYVSGYSVQIFSGTNPLYPAGSLVKEATVSLPAYTVDTALQAGTYSWRVRRIDSSTNPGAWRELTDLSALPTFTVSAPAPGLSTPEDASVITGNGVLFTWTGVVGATQYRVESSKSIGFGTLLESQVTPMTAWAPIIAYPDAVPVYWRVRALDSANNVLSTSVVRSFTKDATGPTASIDLGSAATSLTPAIKVSLSEAATGVSASSVKLTKTGGIAVTTTLECANAGASTVPCSGTDVRSVTVTPTSKVVPGETYTIAVTNAVTDAQGNPATGVSKSFRAVLSVQQNAGSIVYAGTWTNVTLSTASGGSYTKATAKTASATWTFRGTSAKLSYIAQKGAGKAKLYVDGVLKGTLDQYSSSPTKRIFTIALSSGVHTMKIVPAGLKSPAATSTAINIDVLSTS